MIVDTYNYMPEYDICGGSAVGTLCSIGDSKEAVSDRMKVYVVYDPLYERVISVHGSVEGATDRSELENDKDNRWNTYYRIEYQEFELEE